MRVCECGCMSEYVCVCVRARTVHCVKGGEPPSLTRENEKNDASMTHKTVLPTQSYSLWMCTVKVLCCLYVISVDFWSNGGEGGKEVNARHRSDRENAQSAKKVS